MKIKLSDKETYEIQLKDEITVQELNEILIKLNSLAKIFSKDIFSLVNKEIREKRHYNTKRMNARTWCDTREKAVAVIKLHYSGNKENKLKFAQEVGESWNTIVKGMHGLKTRYDIKPQEVGLEHFPTRGGRGGNSL